MIETSKVSAQAAKMSKLKLKWSKPEKIEKKTQGVRRLTRFLFLQGSSIYNVSKIAWMYMYIKGRLSCYGIHQIFLNRLLTCVLNAPLTLNVRSSEFAFGAVKIPLAIQCLPNCIVKRLASLLEF
jgi:hypothetical protein